MIRCAGGTRQLIPENGFKLLDVVRNMGTPVSWVETAPYTGTVPGYAIRSVDRSTLDHTDPEWHRPALLTTEVLHYSYDTRDRRGFYVYPAQPEAQATRQLVEIIYAASPNELTNLADVIGLDDVYQPALLSYILHRAYAKDIPVEGMNAGQRAAAYFQQFMVTLMGQPQDDARLHPLQMQRLKDE